MSSTLAPYGIDLIHVAEEVPENQSGTFEEVVCEKVQHAFRIAKGPVISTDSGIAIPALNGFPGTLTRPVLEQLGIDRIIRMLEPGEDRTCYFQTALGFMDAHLQHPMVFSKTGEYGTLTHEKRGSVTEERHSIWQVFVPKGQSKTIAEMTEEEMQEYRRLPAVSGYIEAFVRWFLYR